MKVTIPLFVFLPFLCSGQEINCEKYFPYDSIDELGFAYESPASPVLGWNSVQDPIQVMQNERVGIIWIAYVVDKIGKVQCGRVVKVDNDLLEAIALKRIENTLFIPAKQRGKSVNSIQVTRLVFRQASFQFIDADQDLKDLVFRKKRENDLQFMALNLEEDFQNIESAIISSQKLHEFLDLDGMFDISEAVFVADSKAIIDVYSSSWHIEYLLELMSASTLRLIELRSMHSEPIPLHLVDIAKESKQRKTKKKKLRKKED